MSTREALMEEVRTTWVLYQAAASDMGRADVPECGDYWEAVFALQRAIRGGGTIEPLPAGSTSDPSSRKEPS